MEIVELELSQAPSTRRWFIAAFIGAPLLVAAGVTAASRPGTRAQRPSLSPQTPLAPQVLPRSVNPGVNLLRNGDFELDVMGVTITDWSRGVAPAVCAPAAEGIPATA